VQTGDKLTESQANRFASAFLMPRRYFAAECRSALRGSRLNWGSLTDIKLRWGVSKAAVLYRARQLGVFSEEQYRTGVISLNRRGEARREVEDDQMALEVPEMIADSIQALRECVGMSRAALAEEMKVQTSLVDELLAARFDTGSLSTRPDNVVRISHGH
jgi:Zn-dependent peptidase ImmA (M78 family)